MKIGEIWIEKLSNEELMIDKIEYCLLTIVEFPESVHNIDEIRPEEYDIVFDKYGKAKHDDLIHGHWIVGNRGFCMSRPDFIKYFYRK